MSLVKVIRAKLKAGEFRDVFILLQDNKNEALLQIESMDIVSTLTENLTEENLQDDFKLFSNCENLLRHVAGKCSPHEVLFELLEKVELTKNDEIFISLLKVLQIVLLRLNEKKARSLEWSLNAIFLYIEAIELPDFVACIGSDEEKLLECDKTIQRILQLYMTVLLFLKPIIKVSNRENSTFFESTGLTRKSIVICFILQLMGKPLVYLNVHCPTSNVEKSGIHGKVDIALKPVRTYVRVCLGNYTLDMKSCLAVQRIQGKMCSTFTIHQRETFNEFRAREEQKDALHQTPTNINTKKRENEDDAQVLAIKGTIMKEALGFVFTHGWSKQAIAKGAENINYLSLANGLFPRGGIELVQYFYRQCNETLVEHLKQETYGIQNFSDPVIFTRKAIEIRLRMLTPYLKHWPQALGLMSLPPNVPKSLANVLTLVDDICYYAGDRSVDFNWYTRRLGVASIYKATELYMLQDSSTDFEKTWKFLERRIEEANSVHECLLNSERATSQIQNAMGSTFSTARNMLGLNFDRQ